MSEDPTPEEIRKSIVPKSDQLNADDLVTGPITVTIEKVSRGDKDQPIVVSIAGYPGRPFKPCKSMRRVLIAAFGDDPKKWIGQRMTLYCDPEVTWAGVKVGGIRISHLSGLSEPKTFLLTRTRGKKSEYTIMPLKASADEQAFIDEVLGEIAKADTPEILKAIGFVVAKKPKPIQDAVRAAYAARQKELQVS